MFKRIASLCILIITMIVNSNVAEARVKNAKKKKKAHKTHRVSKHKKKSRHYKHGNGPDLKSITTDSPYTEDSNNGVNPIETK